MIKTIFSVLLLMVCGVSAFAQELDRTKGYRTQIGTVAVGYYGHVGVQLTGSTTCNGRNVLILANDNPLFDEIYSLLLASKMGGEHVHFGPTVGAQLFSAGHCLVDEVAIDELRGWSKQ